MAQARRVLGDDRVAWAQRICRSDSRADFHDTVHCGGGDGLTGDVCGDAKHGGLKRVHPTQKGSHLRLLVREIRFGRSGDAHEERGHARPGALRIRGKCDVEGEERAEVDVAHGALEEVEPIRAVDDEVLEVDGGAGLPVAEGFELEWLAWRK